MQRGYVSWRCSVVRVHSLPHTPTLSLLRGTEGIYERLSRRRREEREERGRERGERREVRGERREKREER